MGHVILWAFVMDGRTWKPPSLTDSLTWISDHRRLSQDRNRTGPPAWLFITPVSSLPHPSFIPRLCPYTSSSLLQDYPAIHHRAQPFHICTITANKAHPRVFRPPSSLGPICMQPHRSSVSVFRGGTPAQAIRAAGKTGAEKKETSRI